MHKAAGDTPVARARHAASHGDWQQAYTLLREAETKGLLSRADRPFLCDVAYAAGHLDVTIEMWERMHVECLEAGDVLAAAGAAARVAMHLLLDTTLMAPVRGWVARAERLLAGHEETAVHAWLAVVRSYERLQAGDLKSARVWADRAIEVGSKQERAAAAIGRVAMARTVILEGDIRRGLVLLEEAGVATASGELDPLSTGIVYCELVCALQGLAHYDLAEEWTEAMERWCPSGAIGSVHGRCRVHRAEILRLRGSCDDAEKEALAACEELRPYLGRELGWPLCELGRIRLMKGNLDGAEEAFLRAHQAGWEPQPGLALVHLARGDVALAAAAIRDALEHPTTVPSKELPPNTELRRVPLLEAQVPIEIAAGDLGRARLAADELERVATMFESKALAANAALAMGRVLLAEGDAAKARSHFDVAARLWNEVGAPYEVALARQGLAGAYRAEGNDRRAAIELQAVQAAFERIGAMRPVERADRRVAGDNDVGIAPRGGDVFHCEGDYWSVTFDGRTVRVRDLKGMRYLGRLLAEPGREFHALDLVALENEAGVPATDRPRSTQAEGGAMLDQRAKDAYRRRLAEIEEDIVEAEAMGDGTRAAQAEVERHFIVRELSRALGLGGRDRRTGSDSERARASVTRAVRQAMTRIREHHPSLGKHLDRVIRTGAYCAYVPDPRAPMEWTF